MVKLVIQWKLVITGKKKVLIVPTTIVKSTKPVTRPIKSKKIHVRYPCIIYSDVKHRFGECPIKVEVQNMFKTKLINSNVTTSPKPPKTHNVPVNVVVILTTRNRVKIILHL